MTLPFMFLLNDADRAVSNYAKRLLARILIPALLAQKFALLAAASILALSPPTALAAEEYFANYASSSDSTRIDLGIQPLGYPAGVISALMRRDQILKKALEQSQQSLKTYPFMRGADMLTLFANSRLEAGI
ncbi:MAG: hypothetical protein NTY70_16765, partial [Burkholderiales bacterium]|nr:hypothetical protein [Burkholderiales bacterium]